MNLKTALAALAATALPLGALAQTAEPALDSGDTAFVAACAMIVMLMMLPGLGLFYAGMARSKNVLSVMTHILATIALVCVLWILFG